jgi:hypothetical protein
MLVKHISQKLKKYSFVMQGKSDLSDPIKVLYRTKHYCNQNYENTNINSYIILYCFILFVDVTLIII